MKVCVLGLWHLGTVTAACLAEAGHQVVGLDFDPDTIQNLQAGKPPLFEPGLEELVKENISSGRLSFTTEIERAVPTSQVIWVTYDTPVDEDDNADVEYVINQIHKLFLFVQNGALVLVSSQMPVGSVKRLEGLFASEHARIEVHFGYSPENLRLGKAISVFTQPDRVVVGVRKQAARDLVTALLGPITDRIEWMTVESAEMTKHALNAFLATSVVFANEIASLCEQTGADAKEVERGLKTEARIGPKAYLGPGVAFAGGTLARDIAFLNNLGQQFHVTTPLLSSVKVSNDHHKLWAQDRLKAAFSSLAGRTVAVWGLTYKPGTDTLRRSSSVELCKWLSSQGVTVHVYDPAVKTLPAELASILEVCPTPLAAVQEADALVVSTEWPEFQAVPAEDVIHQMRTKVILDPNRFLQKTLGSSQAGQYYSVGKAPKK